MAIASKGQRLILVAVVLGGVAAVLGYYSLTALSARAAIHQGTQFRDVVVTAADLSYGVKLEPSMVRVVRYPRESIPAGAYSSLDSVVGQTTKVFMSTREPVTALKLSSRGGGLSMLIRPNMRAASIEVNQVSGVSGFVLPGDRVDVLITVDPGHNGQDAITRTLLQNVEVLAAGQKTQQGETKPLTVQSVTLLVAPRGAEILAHAQHEGEIHLVLRNPDDQEQADVVAFSTREMLGRDKPGPRIVRVIAPPPVAAAPKPEEERRIRIIRSADVVETPAVHDGKDH